VGDLASQAAVTADTQSLSLFQQVLLATDGTVTDLVALYTGEQIRVRKLDQQIRTAQAPAMLACADPTPLLTRRILLCGPERAWLYAESVFVYERMPQIIQEQLLNSDRPIGLLWKEQRLETYREIVARTIEESAATAALFGLAASERVVSRTYVIHHGGKPLGAITEKWPLLYFR
jgi:chorismate-pyruvate lyase